MRSQIIFFWNVSLCIKGFTPSTNYSLHKSTVNGLGKSETSNSVNVVRVVNSSTPLILSLYQPNKLN